LKGNNGKSTEGKEREIKYREGKKTNETLCAKTSAWRKREALGGGNT